MKDYVETKYGKTYFKDNLYHGDKLEVTSWLNTIREQLASCINTLYRSADYDELHQNLYSKTLEEVQIMQETTSKVENLLKEYITNKN